MAKTLEELNEETLSNVVGGMNQKEFINYINSDWNHIPDIQRNKIIDKYKECGKSATIKLIEFYMEKYDMYYLEPLIDVLK